MSNMLSQHHNHHLEEQLLLENKRQKTTFQKSQSQYPHHRLFKTIDNTITDTATAITGMDTITKTQNFLQEIYFKDKIKYIKSGSNFIFIVNEKNELFGYGSNQDGQLGFGNSIKSLQNFTKSKFKNSVRMMECGNYFTILVTDFNTIYVTGYNLFGQLGLGDCNKRFEFTKVVNFQEDIKFIRCGLNSTIIVTVDNYIYATGNNEYGQLGLGDFKNRNTFTKVVNFPNIEIKDLQCKGNHVILLNKNNKIYGCGKVVDGQLGEEFTKNISVFKEIRLPFLVKQVVCNVNNSLFLSEENEIYGCGNNEYGQLGLGISVQTQKTVTHLLTDNVVNNTADTITKLYSSTGQQAVFQTKSGELFGCGNNCCGQLGLDKTQHCKRNKYYNECVFNFTKLNFLKYVNYGNTDFKNTFIMLNSLETYFVMSDYVIGEDCLVEIVKQKCYSQLMNERNVDIKINCVL